MAERLRGRAGQAQRRRRLAAEPLCRRCGDRGLVIAATVPDHIVPLTKGGSDDDSNIRCLCAACHRAVTAEQFDQQLASESAIDGLPTDPEDPWSALRQGEGGSKV